MKRTMAAAFSVAVSVQLLGASFAASLQTQTTTMTDTKGYWAQPQIQALLDTQLMTGYTDGTFRPEKTISRAEFASLLVKALQLNTTEPQTATYKDVPSDFWAYKAIETVKARGFMTGTPEDNFMPNRPVDRLTVIKALAAAVPGQTSATTTNLLLENFNDAASIKAEDKAEVAQAIQTGIFANNPRYGAFIQPYRNATRGEVAVMVSNLLANETGTTQIPVATTTNNYYVAKYSNGNLRPYLLGHYQKVDQKMGVNEGRTITVPSNTQFVGRLDAPVNTLNRNGSQVQFKLGQPIASKDDVIVVPTGSTVTGQVIGTHSNNGIPTVNVGLKEIVLTNGERLNVQGEVASFEQPLQETPVAQYVRVKLNSPMELQLP